MCINDEDLICESRCQLTKRQQNLCNDQLTDNRIVVLCALAACISNSIKPLKCLEGLGICGINSMLWKKYFKEQVNITVNGVHEEDAKLIFKNFTSNGLKGDILNVDTCILLRQEVYDFVFLNCSTKASHYLDSIFSNIKEEAVLVLLTSEDPSLYWQIPEGALKNYGGTITKTSYHRELAVRLVLAEMARACARYNKGLKVLCTIAYKPQQSFTIIVKVKKGSNNAKETLKSIKTLAHCILCENRKFLSDSKFIDKINFNIGCNCSENDEGRVIISVGPLWTGDIFNAQFIQSMIQQSKDLSFGYKVHSLLNLILEEARCFEKSIVEYPKVKQPKLLNQTSVLETEKHPYFYFNSHRLSPKVNKLQKTKTIIQILENNGFYACLTHFDPEAIRTNASFGECIKILKNYSLNEN